MSEENTDLVTPPPPAASTAIAKRDAANLQTLPQIGGAAGLEWHNFTGDRMTVWRLKALAQSGADKGGSVAGEVVPVKWWYVQQVQIFDDATRESIDAFRCVLMRPDTTSIAFVSTGVLRSLQSMVEAIGPGPYDPAINVVIKQDETRRGRRVYSIVPE